MNPPTRRTLFWVLLATALFAVWSFRPKSAPEVPAASRHAVPPQLISTAAAVPEAPASAGAAWNHWRTQLPAAKQAMKEMTEDAMESPTNRAEVFEKFRVWQAQHRAAAGNAGLEAEGIALAKARRVAMARWIERDPEFALSQAVGPDARGELPAAVLAELERWVEGRGGLEVSIRCGPEVKLADQVSRVVRVDGGSSRRLCMGGGWGRRRSMICRFTVWRWRAGWPCIAARCGSWSRVRCGSGGWTRREFT